MSDVETDALRASLESWVGKPGDASGRSMHRMTPAPSICPLTAIATWPGGQGAPPDCFMKILTTNGYMARFVTDWAGPEARLRFSERGVRTDRAGEQAGVEVEIRAANELGDHAAGRVVATLALDQRAEPGR